MARPSSCGMGARAQGTHFLFSSFLLSGLGRRAGAGAGVERRKNEEGVVEG